MTLSKVIKVTSKAWTARQSVYTSTLLTRRAEWGHAHGCRQKEEVTLQRVLSFLQLQEATPAEIAQMAQVQANRGHATNSKHKG